MAKRTFLAGVTSQTMDVFIQDSSSTIGAGLSGLVFNTSNLKAYYRKGATGTATAITLATQTVGGAWSSGGFVEVDATNMKGVYRFDIPDTILAATPAAIVYFYGATNMAPNVSELEIVSYNPFDGVRLGLTALPNATVSGVGGLLTAPTTANVGLADLSRILGTALTETAGLLAGGFKKFFNVSTPTGTLNSIPDAVPDASGGLPVTGNRLTAIPTIATVTTVTNQLTAAAIATGVWQDATAGDFTTASSIGKALYVSNVVPGAAGGHFIAGTNAATIILTGLTTTFTGNLTGSVASVTGLTASDVGAIKTQTDKMAFTVTNQIDANVLDWKSATAPAMTGDAFARLGAPAGASVSADIAAAKVDTAAIKTKTDSLTFTVAGYLATDIRYVKGTLVTGAGTAGSPWGP